jgi:hypothetical protein
MPLLDRFARKVWMHSVRANHADWLLGVKRVKIAIKLI